MELRETKKLVERLLREVPALRADDDLLFLEVLKKFSPHWNNSRINTNIENVSIGEFFAERKKRKLPSYEGVRRSRAKVMAEHPELKPSEKVQKARKAQEEVYYNFTKQQNLSF